MSCHENHFTMQMKLTSLQWGVEGWQFLCTVLINLSTILLWLTLVTQYLSQIGNLSQQPISIHYQHGEDGELPWRDIFTTTLPLCLDRPRSRLRYQWITQRTMSGQRVLSDTRALPCGSITRIIDSKTDLWICHTGAGQCRCLSCLTSSLWGYREEAPGCCVCLW